jgi:hypothetical protein
LNDQNDEVENGVGGLSVLEAAKLAGNLSDLQGQVKKYEI